MWFVFSFDRITILEEHLHEAKSETKQKVEEESQKYTAALVRIFIYFLNRQYFEPSTLKWVKNILESMKDWDFLNISVAQCNPCKVFEFAIPLLLALLTKSNHCFKLLQKTKKYRHYLQLVFMPRICFDFSVVVYGFKAVRWSFISSKNDTSL